MRAMPYNLLVILDIALMVLAFTCSAIPLLINISLAIAIMGITWRIIRRVVVGKTVL